MWSQKERQYITNGEKLVWLLSQQVACQIWNLAIGQTNYAITEGIARELPRKSLVVEGASGLPTLNCGVYIIFYFLFSFSFYFAKKQNQKLQSQGKKEKVWLVSQQVACQIWNLATGQTNYAITEGIAGEKFGCWGSKWIANTELWSIYYFLFFIFI